jgi:hypothetical protein
MGYFEVPITKLNLSFKHKMNFDCSTEQWNRFCQKGIQDGNLIGDFGKMTKEFGKAYLSYLNAAYIAKDEMTDSEFIKEHGVNDKFLSKFK